MFWNEKILLAFGFRKLYSEGSKYQPRNGVIAVDGCPISLHKRRRIDELEEEIKDLRTNLRCQERQAQDGLFA